MSFQFTIPEEFLPLARLQVTQLGQAEIEAYTQLSAAEYNAYNRHLDKPERVLELGCGLGRGSIYLHQQLQDPTITYFLADSTAPPPAKQAYGWNSSDGFYNDLGQTARFCRLNGLRQFRVLDLADSSALARLRHIDTVISFMSIGFHCPLAPYLDTLAKIITPDAVLIFGVRDPLVEYAKYRPRFRRAKVEPVKEKTAQNLLILRGRVR